MSKDCRQNSVTRCEAKAGGHKSAKQTNLFCLESKLLKSDHDFTPGRTSSPEP